MCTATLTRAHLNTVLLFLLSLTTAAPNAAFAEDLVAKIASENGTFKVQGTKTVRYGTGSSWVQKTLIGDGVCGTYFFGKDPAPGRLKECAAPVPTTPPSLAPLPTALNLASQTSSTGAAPVAWAKVANEWQNFSVSGSKLVRFGSGSSWVQKTVTGTSQCSSFTFGSDPARAVLKECYVALQDLPKVNLATLQTPANDTLQYVGTTSGCKVGFNAGSALNKGTPAAIPTGGGAFFSSAHLARWRSRVADGPFVSNSDYKNGTPGDWARLLANANTFMTYGEPVVTPSNRSTSGGLARDAAFVGLVSGNSAMIAAVRAHLLAAAQATTNDFTSLCYRAMDGSSPGADGYMDPAAWLNRYAVIYDLIRSQLSTTDRITLENWFRAQAFFFAGQLDYDLATIFPNRLAGDYSVRLRDASSATKTPYLSGQLDTNGDCYHNAADDPTAYPIYAYVDAAGRFGPRISTLSQWYNNRRGNLVVALGTVGALLNDTVLINRAKRYHMEWLTWAVFPDGSEGEYARAGNYCLAQQGIIYAQNNIQSMLQLARWLKDRGDTSLIEFNTLDGAWGTQVPAGQAAKNMELVVSTQLKLITGKLNWYLAEPWLNTQNPRLANSYGRQEGRYMNSGTTIDLFNQLGMLIAEDVLPNQPIRAIMLRDPAVTNLRFPGSTGNFVNTGKGSWSDAFGAFPAAFMWEL